MHDLLDQLDAFEETVPGLAGRLDYDSVAIAGHSHVRRRPATHIRVHTPGVVLRPLNRRKRLTSLSSHL